MIIPDINLLVYTYNADAAYHLRSKVWREGLLNDTENIVGLPWVVSIGFLRIMTHPRVLETPLHPREAIHRVKEWYTRSNVEILVPGPSHLDIVSTILSEIGSAASLTTAAHSAALAIKHQAKVLSNDNDFGRFTGVRWENPLLR